LKCLSSGRGHLADVHLAVDFGITQVVDGNWGVHAIVGKSLFAAAT
jgi:acetamidase/formamidase